VSRDKEGEKSVYSLSISPRMRFGSAERKEGKGSKKAASMTAMD